MIKVRPGGDVREKRTRSTSVRTVDLLDVNSGKIVGSFTIELEQELEFPKEFGRLEPSVVTYHKVIIKIDGNTHIAEGSVKQPEGMVVGDNLDVCISKLMEQAGIELMGWKK